MARHGDADVIDERGLPAALRTLGPTRLVLERPHREVHTAAPVSAKAAQQAQRRIDLGYRCDGDAVLARGARPEVP